MPDKDYQRSEIPTAKNPSIITQLIRLAIFVAIVAVIYFVLSLTGILPASLQVF